MIKEQGMDSAFAKTPPNLLIAGVDEAGRGSLAGPVITAAVILNPETIIEGLADSKKLSLKKREELYEKIITNCKAFAIARADVDEIDRLNVLRSTLLAMQRAINQFSIQPDKVLIDGHCSPNLPYETQAVVQGDQIVPAISAASILAKVTRDREMLKYDVQYPDYGFAIHKGYGTKAHLVAIHRFGITPVHRKSFEPVRQLKLFIPEE